MAWLVRGGDVLATLELAERRAARRRGLLGRDAVEGALLLRPVRHVHSFGMRIPIDVAYCDADLVVLRIARLDRNRPGPVVRSTRAVVEAEVGAFERWKVVVGDQLEVRGAEGGEGT